MGDLLTVLAADPNLDEPSWAVLISAATGVPVERLLGAAADPEVTADLENEEALTAVLERRCAHDPDGGAAFHSSVACRRGGQLPAPPVTAAGLRAALTGIAPGDATGRSPASLVITAVPARQVVADLSPTPAVAAAAALGMISDGHVAHLDLTRRGMDRRVNVDAVAHLLAALPPGSTRLVLEGAFAGGLTVERATLVAVAAVVAAEHLPPVGHLEVSSVNAPGPVVAAALEMAVGLFTAPLTDPGAAPSAAVLNHSDLAHRCAVWAAAHGAPLLGKGSIVDAYCGPDPGTAHLTAVHQAWRVIRDVDGCGGPVAGAFIEAVTGGGAREVPLVHLDLPALLGAPAHVSARALFAAVGISDPRPAIAEGIVDAFVEVGDARDTPELIDALDAHPHLDHRVCLAAPTRATARSPVPRWLVERSQRRVGLAARIEAVPEARAELVRAAAGIGMSRWAVIATLLESFRGTPAELVELTAELAPPS